MEGTLAEIRMFAGNFAPRGWMLCQGQLLSISQWTAVFALVGTTYGGNGQTTFGIPDFRGRIPLGTGNGAGLPSVDLGEMAGVQNTTLILPNLPMHNHTLTGALTVKVNNTTAGQNSDPENRYLQQSNIYTDETGDLNPMNPGEIDYSSLQVAINGSNAPFSNQSPFLGINYIFCVEGIFPSRN